MSQSLKAYNTFAVESSSSNIFIINQQTDIQKLLQHDLSNPEHFLLIGAGSNLLLLEAAPDLVIAMRMENIAYSTPKHGNLIVTAEAGVSWHHLVQDSLDKGFYGLENLALIPGLVGAAPIQNIGAYGVELADRFIALKAVNLLTGKERVFTKAECRFGYRDSFFKTSDGQSYLIVEVSLSLSTEPMANLDYKALQEAFSGQETVDAMMIFEKVCEMRNNKLPDPAKLGNAGSFFKNPVVHQQQYLELKQQFPDLIAYQQIEGNWKLAAGWIIEKTGLKGYRTGAVGVHINQALVLVNYGGANGLEIVHLAQYVQQRVEEKFSIRLEPEVTIIGARGVINIEDIQ